MSKLSTLLEIEGYSDLEELFTDSEYGSVPGVPGICSNENCEYSTRVEPDSDSGWCEECESNTVVSAYILAGII